METKIKKIIFTIIFLSAFFVILTLTFKPFGNYISGLYSESNKGNQSLSTEEVQVILKKIEIPDAKIVEIRMSPVKCLWEVVLENKGRYLIFYIDPSHKYLVAGQIVEIDRFVDKTRERLDELYSKKRIDLSLIPLKDALLIGDKNSTKKVIVFTDPDCPFCGKLHWEIKKVVEIRKDISFYLKLLPLQMHPDAYWKSKSIICTKSLKLLEDNFEKKPPSKKDCSTKEIDENIKLAEALGITGTPTVIMSDGSIHAGFLSADELIKKIDSSPPPM